MTRQTQPRDDTRRRVVLGLAAVGAVALGLRTVRAPYAESGTAAEPAPADPTVTPVPSSPTSAAPAARTSRAPATSTSMEPTPTTAPELSVVVACREAWGAQPAADDMTEHVPVRLTLHHTAVSQTAPTQGPARARRHQRYHRSLGWPDLAYHFLVERSGLAYEGRDVRFRGDTATEYDPTGHFLVCMEGDFDVQEPTPVQVETTVALFGWASQRFGIAAETLAGHRDYAVTSCPGASVAAMIPDMVVAVATIDPVMIEFACGVAGAELVAAIEAD